MMLLLGGTSDSLSILSLLNEMNIPVITSVVTDYGRHLAESFGQPVIQGRMSSLEMIELIRKNKIQEIIDATHPFAEIVSKEAIKAAHHCKIRYLRYERQSTEDLSGAIVVNSIQEAIRVIKINNFQNVYLATGSKTLPVFVDALPTLKIKARVLPTSEVMVICEKLGMGPDQIDALKAPFSKECNKELIKRSGADVFVSKESGEIGGVRDKIDGCLELGISCIIIKRPLIDYPIMVSNIKDLEGYLVLTKTKGENL